MPAAGAETRREVSANRLIQVFKRKHYCLIRKNVPDGQAVRWKRRVRIKNGSSRPVYAVSLFLATFDLVREGSLAIHNNGDFPAFLGDAVRPRKLNLTLMTGDSAGENQAVHVYPAFGEFSGRK